MPVMLLLSRAGRNWQVEMIQERTSSFLLVLFAILALAGCRQERTNKAAPPAITRRPTPQPTTTPTATPEPTLEPRWSGTIAVDKPIEINLSVDTTQPISARNPAVVSAEIVGFDLNSVRFVAGPDNSNGESLLVVELRPEPQSLEVDEFALLQGGLKEVFHIWAADGWSLGDGETSAVVIPEEYAAVDGDSQVLSVPAILVGTDEPDMEVMLLFRLSDGELTDIRTVDGDESLEPSPGLEFQIKQRFIIGQGQLEERPGPVLTIREERGLLLRRQQVEPGTYLVGFVVQSDDGRMIGELERVSVASSEAVEGFRTFVDAREGYSLLHPAEWLVPVVQGSRLISADGQDRFQLTVTTYPDVSGMTAEQLKRQTLRAFGDVQLLFEDLVPVGDVGGLWTAYGYEAASGQRTGIFITVLRNGRGYIIDIDGPTDEEAYLLDVIRSVAANWRFRPDGLNHHPGSWQRTQIGSLRVIVPIQYGLAHLDNGWERFIASARGTFIALQVTPQGEDAEVRSLENWLEVASRGVTDFLASKVYQVAFAGPLWNRADFEYTNQRGVETLGFLMEVNLDGQRVLAWAEAPADSFEHIELNEFLVVLSTISFCNCD